MNSTHNADQNLDRVLKALTEVTPPAGMERRILNTLETHSIAKGVVPRIPATKSGAPFMRSMGGIAQILPLRWITLSCAATLAIAIVAIRHHPAPVSHQPTTVTAGKSASPSTDNPIEPQNRVPHLRGDLIAAKVGIRAAREPRLIAAAQPETTTPISHPAPPLPLTEQEKLLIRFVRRSNPNDLAEISDERKTAREQKAAEEFTAFFTPPPPPPINGESE